MIMLSEGDRVSVLDENINGIVKAVKNNQVIIETDDGFMISFLENELIKLNQENNLLDTIKRVDIVEITKLKDTPKVRSFIKDKKSKHEFSAPEFDLHIEKLVPNKRGLTNYDILNLQTETAKRHIEFAIKNRIPKIVFIHGVGEGILKAELDFLLGRYDNIAFQDANYQKYGLGATEVYIKQSAM